MPLYEYECDACSHRFEKIQKFSDPLEDTCPKCGGPVRKLSPSPAIQFKGSGFYITDYAKKEHVAAEKADSASGKGGKEREPEKSEKSSQVRQVGLVGQRPRRATPAPSSSGSSDSSSSSSSPTSTPKTGTSASIASKPGT